MRKQHYMTEQERHQLEAMRRNKIPVREIARQLGFCERTIYYELRRIPVNSGTRNGTRHRKGSRYTATIRPPKAGR